LFLYKFKEEREIKLECIKKQDSSNTGFDVLKFKSYKGTNLLKTPDYKNYRSDIIAWVIFWIPSFIGTLLDDFVRKLVTFIVNRFGRAFQYLSQKIVGDFLESK
jgi:hypothetical protein